MNYLLYVEFAAENLQFYLWLKNYVKRFNDLPDSEKALAKPVDTEKQDNDLASPNIPRRPTIPKAETNIITISNRIQSSNPFDDDAAADDKDIACSDMASMYSGRGNHQIAAVSTFGSIDVQYEPFTIQPYREEISRIISIYISDGAPRQLNLSSKERAELLRNLANTTHPSAFLPVLKTVEWTLKHQAHPNFIRWTICNGNKPRQMFAHGLGMSGVVVGLAIMAPLVASGFSRAWRVFGALPILFGIATSLAAWKGLCVILYGQHHRHLRPWELFADDNEAASNYEMKRGSWDSFGSKVSYEDEPWVIEYKRRNTFRKVFDVEIWIQEPALRRIQDTIFLQSLLVSIVLTAALVGGFCAIPPGNRF